jgi:hypothetical protein
MASRLVMGAALGALTIALAACRSETPQQSANPSASSPAASSTESHDGHTMARVFFVAPKNGETVKSPVRFEFGSDNIQIAAVPEGTVTADQVRPNVGHYHLGVDQDCLPPGTEIPRGKPDWVHFGTGNNSIEMNLTPGPHKFAVQVGDDRHYTVEGLCETITINVQ